MMAVASTMEGLNWCIFNDIDMADPIHVLKRNFFWAGLNCMHNYVPWVIHSIFFYPRTGAAGMHNLKVARLLQALLLVMPWVSPLCMWR